MPLSEAVITNGTTVQVGDGAVPEVFTPIAEVVDIDPPSGEAAEVEVTHLTSDAKEFRGGLRDFGSGTMTVNLIDDDASQQQLEDDLATGEIRNYRIVPPAASTAVPRAFAAFVKAFKLAQIAIDQPYRAVITLRASGPVTRVAP